jgi:hypothetical protein
MNDVIGSRPNRLGAKERRGNLVAVHSKGLLRPRLHTRHVGPPNDIVY